MPGASSLHLITLHHRCHGAVAFILYIDIILCRAGISLNLPKNVAPFLIVYQDYFAHIEIVIPHAAQGELAGIEPQLLYSPLVELAST